MTNYLLLLLAPFAAGFVVQQHRHARWNLRVSGNSVDWSAGSASEMERAKECAERFGACDVDEVEELRDSIHDARVRSMFLSNLGGGTAPLDEQLFEQRLIEEDLTLQLNLLKNEMPESALFPEEATMHPEKLEAETASTQAIHLMDENLLESLAICAVFGILAMAPHLLNL